MDAVPEIRPQIDGGAAPGAADPLSSGPSKAIFLICAAAVLATARCATAQVQAGDFNMNLSGTVSGGYASDSGNLTPSDHTFNGAGDATLAGFFYNPNLLSFKVQPFYNQSRANSDFQSITSASGVTASTSIFGGSEFPGTISYSRTFNGTGNFGIPDVASYTSHGDSQTFSVGWSELVPHLPTLTVGYQQGSNQYSLYGTNEDTSSAFRSLTANSTYQLLGFTLNAGYHYTATHLDVPQLFSGEQQPSTTDSSGNSFSFGIGHRLPFNGSASAGASRSDLTEDSAAGPYHATFDTVSSGLSFNPIARLNVGANAQYTDNLTGMLYQSILASGGIVAENTPNFSTHALDVTGYANYMVPVLHMTFSANDDHRDQAFAGTSLQADSQTGTASYSNNIWNGYLNAVLGLTHSVVNPGDQSRLGLLGSLSYSRDVGSWKITGQGSYAQNQQTILIAYTASSYGYSGTLGRKIGRRAHWSATGGGTRSGLSNQPGAGTFSQYYSTAFSAKWLSASAAFTRSNGNGILTAAGVTATPVPLPIVTPGGVILYGGSSYSFGLGATPVRGLTVSASYSKALSSTAADGLSSSSNHNEQLIARIQYLIRKIYFQAGYIKLSQGFSQIAGPAAMTSSVYVGLSRWFNFF
ncbi:MAG TPA: hypothetical protein VKR61_12280 [Bryobacteraceae bacterium]|nr:hypothetical protein [Bryobacteraceae bacterium]